MGLKNESIVGSLGTPTLSDRFASHWVSPGLGVGIVGGAAAAVFYTISNISLRNAISVDPFLVSAIKAAPTVLFLTPYLIAVKASGRPIARSWHLAPRFAIVALVGQLVGNAAFQIALGYIGLAASVPITLGVMLIGGAILGRWVLGEAVNAKTVFAIITLMAAVMVLCLTKQPEDAATISRLESGSALWGAACAASSGAAYALFSTVMRLTMRGGMTAASVMWVSGMVGSTALWAITFSRVPMESLAQISGPLWQSMVIAGVFNFIAFVALSASLRVLPVVAVNLINASQVAMAATAGVILFHEKITWSLAIGIGLTLLGLLVLARRNPTRANSH